VKFASCKYCDSVSPLVGHRVLFELIWRDYFRFISMKYGNTIFHVGGPRSVVGKLWSQNKERFEAWQEGRTGYF
jgi:deoxyribodipyrimidine photo-lyase